jgi:hypothetical protein
LIARKPWERKRPWSPPAAPRPSIQELCSSSSRREKEEKWFEKDDIGAGAGTYSTAWRSLPWQESECAQPLHPLGATQKGHGRMIPPSRGIYHFRAIGHHHSSTYEAGVIIKWVQGHPQHIINVLYILLYYIYILLYYILFIIYIIIYVLESTFCSLRVVFTSPGLRM